MAESRLILDDLHNWLDDYLPNIEGKRPRTIKSYRASWRLMIKYLQSKDVCLSKITYDTLNYDTVKGFLAWLQEVRGCNTASRNNRLAAISKFAKYAQIIDFQAAYPFVKAMSSIPYKKGGDSKERAYFKHDELKIFLALPTPKGKMGYRDHVLLQYMYATGERADEVCITQVKDIRFLSDGKASILVHGKGGKTRRIKIGEHSAAMLKKYLNYRKIQNYPDEYVFPSQRNPMMSVSCVEEIFEKYVTLAKKQNPDKFLESSYPPHSMRHTTAMHMLEAGVPLVVVKQFLGHAHITTTEIYAKLSPEVANEKLLGWDKKYWDEYMDEPCTVALPETEEDDGIPNFLK